ncbi:PhzF family phenazine biosynthesis protein [Tellurirhabdus bombi]|uniref:PhzF family phenazine biosynthesis protein n=1 Tax=Tellurirhabdus bombi TaxID=2907205 RepID=UPI001F22E83D|nr:PhzF family phenazine biosynthesis protein [Tellurirhabdus bombi]
MALRLYQLDAFTDRLFGGNPAAVCPLEEWLPDETMQNIACENNLPETAFYVKTENGYHIRWFTPEVEVDLCGHATLATAYVIFFLEKATDEESIDLDSRSGILRVRREADWLILDFPADSIHTSVQPPALSTSLNIKPIELYKGKSDYLLVYENQQQILDLDPDLAELSTVPARGVIVTAPGDDVDFVSRFFAPQSGVNEDPVTGSAHTTLTPFWAERLGKNELIAKQVSKRGGYLKCSLKEDRVEIAGQVRLYMTGEIEV